MDSALTPTPDLVVMAQWIQALTANVQELMKQNEELKCRARLEGSNASHHRHNCSQHDEEANNTENSKGKDATKYTGQSMHDNDHMMKSSRREINEVKNAMKGKTAMNLDGMLKQTNSSFTASVLECLCLRSSACRSWSFMMVQRILLTI